ncbi:MAG: VWA domain-containing protein [Anaeromyxobacteraceae bacterium]
MTPPGPTLPIPFLGYAARLAEPRALWLLAAVAGVATLGAWGVWRRRRALAAAAGALAPRIAPGANVTRPAARLGLSVTGLALLALALARPQCGSRTEIARRYGADLVVVLDASRSMTARDVKPDRLARAKLELSDLLDRLAGDRVALVAFAGSAFVQCPLTTDYAAAKLFLRTVDPELLPQQGTALGPALLAARDALVAGDRAAARAKLVLVVSDGEDQEGGVDAAARELAEAGIVVHALAIGTREGAPIPVAGEDGGVQAYKKDRAGNTVVTRLDDASLAAVVAAGGGQVFELGAPGRGVDAFRAELDKVAKSELESRLTVVYEDRYAVAAFPAFLLLLGALLVRERGRTPDEEAA